MTLIPLRVTKETVDIRRAGLVIYETDQDSSKPGVLLLSDTNGDHGLMIVNQIHQGGPVVVMTRPFCVPAKKYNVNDQIGFLAIL